MSQFYSFHDSATKFATQHIFVCPLEQAICPSALALLTNFNKQPLSKAAEQPITNRLRAELLGGDQDWHKFSPQIQQPHIWAGPEVNHSLWCESRAPNPR